jgi:hypothetical protein
VWHARRVRLALSFLGVAWLLAAAPVACRAADPARATGEPVSAPVACIDLPPAAQEPPTAATALDAPDPSGEPAATDDPENEPVDSGTATPPPFDASGPAGLSSRDPCGGRCTGDTICWVYEHRPAPPPAPATFSFDEEDASGVPRELHCLSAAARCPRGTGGQSSKMIILNGVMSKWMTCTFYGPP